MEDFSVKFSVFLIISLSAVAETEHTICLTRTGDAGPTVARRTVAAEGVFEGRSEGLWALLESVPAADRRTPLNVSFFVIKVHKGRTIPESRTVVVEVHGGGGGGGGNESCSSRGSDEDVFVVFIRQVSPPVQEPNYYLSDHIVPATEQVIRDVGDYACAKCGLPIKVHLPEHVTIEEGMTLKLKCQTKGSPKPRIYWSKDGRPLVLDSRMKLMDRLASTLQIKKIRQEDAGTYQCYASTAVANSSLASSELVVIKAEYPASIHGELCEQQDYCMYNGKCYLLRPLGRKYCVCAKGFKGRQCTLKDASVSVGRLEQSDENLLGVEPVNRTFIVCVIVVGSVLLTTIIILTLCIIRLCQTKKKPLLKENDDKCLRELLPILPDGHQTIVNVKRLSAVLNQQSLSDFDGTHPSASLCFPGSMSLDKVREDEQTTNFGPVHAGRSGCRQSGSRPSASNKEQRRANRLSTVSDGVTGHRRSWIGGNRLSATGDQLGFSNDGQHPVIGSDTGATRPSKIARARAGGATVPPATGTDFRPREDPRESAVTGGKQCGRPLEGRAAEDAPAGTGASSETLGKDEHRRSDMEVNCESEADIFGIESSGDELNGGARDASRERSEPSVRTNDCYSSMVSDDSDNSTISMNEDQTLVQRLSEYPFINTNVFNASLNIRESGSDLSWDEYADVPSFANPGLMYSGCS